MEPIKQPDTKPIQPSAGERLILYVIIVLARALPMFGIILIRYDWRTAIVWGVLLSVFYDVLISKNENVQSGRMG